MSYTKTNWDVSTPLNADNFAHIESQASELYAEMLHVDHSSRYYTIAQYASNYFVYPGGGSGSGQDADLLSGMTKTQLLASAVPVNTVIMWHGDITHPPAGFLYCNGANGAPDYRGRMPLGGSTEVGKTGGAANANWTGSVTISGHALSMAEMTNHLHNWNDSYPCSTTFCNYYNQNQEATYTWNSWTTYVGGGGSHGHNDYQPSMNGQTTNYPPAKGVHFLIKN